MNTKGCVIYNMIELEDNHIIQEPKIKKISNMIGKVIGDYKVLEKLIINKGLVIKFSVAYVVKLNTITILLKDI